MSSSSSTLAMESLLPKVHHSLLSFNHRSIIPFSTTVSFRSPQPRPFSSSPFISSSSSSSIKSSPSPSPSPSPLPINDNVFHKPQNASPQTLNPLFSPLTKPTCIAIAATAFFFMRLHLNPAAAATPSPVQPPPAAASESSTAAAENPSQSPIEGQIRNNPGDVTAAALRSLVESNVRDRKIGEAICVVDRLIELEPEELEWPLLKAHLYSYNGEHELAKNGFEDVLKKDPFRTEAYRGLLMATSELNEPTEGLLKRIEGAVNFCKEQKRDSEAREFKLLIAQVKVMEEDYSGALRVYQELVKEEPRDFRPYLCQGVVYTLLRKKDEAEKQFEKYRRLVPENHPYREYFEDNTKIFSQKLERGGIGAKRSEW